MAPVLVMATPSKDAVPKGTFMSIKVNEANLRRGPGKMYPIDWVIQRKFYPVQVVQTFQEWYQIIDVEGSKGWINKKMLTKNRYVIFHQMTVPVYQKPSLDAPILARIKKGVIASLLQIDAQQKWCQLEIRSPRKIKGYTLCKTLWGVKSPRTSSDQSK